MMDDDDLTGESLIFVDFDLTQYGYRAFDWIYHMISASEQLFFDTDGETFFIPKEDIDQWLQMVDQLRISQPTTTFITLQSVIK